MPLLCRHVQVYTLGRLSLDDFFFFASRSPQVLLDQYNLEWIFSNRDSGFQSLAGFRVPRAGFRIPKPRIPDSKSEKFMDSGFPYKGRVVIKEDKSK